MRRTIGAAAGRPPLGSSGAMAGPPGVARDQYPAPGETPSNNRRPRANRSERPAGGHPAAFSFRPDPRRLSGSAARYGGSPPTGSGTPGRDARAAGTAGSAVVVDRLEALVHRPESPRPAPPASRRSEEHTAELQSRVDN